MEGYRCRGREVRSRLRYLGGLFLGKTGSSSDSELFSKKSGKIKQGCGGAIKIKLNCVSKKTQTK
jgi:hypothetical protein